MNRAGSFGLALAVLLPGLFTSALAEDSSLLDAARAGDRSAAIERIERGDDVNARESDGTTALHWAAHARDAALVERLLEAGADAAASNRYGMSVLHVAADSWDGASIRALLEAGADPNATTEEGEAVIMTAARTGAADGVAALIAHGARIDVRDGFYGETPLIWAAAGDHADAVRVLIEHGASPNGLSAAMDYPSRRSGQTILSLGQWSPLMYAARENAVEAGAALIEAGADMDLQDPDGATALVIAIINAQYPFAAMLIEAGANVNLGDNDAGMGPLYAAVDMHTLAVGHGRGNPITHGHPNAVDIARLLLEAGADPDATLKGTIMQRQHTMGDSALGEGATALLRAAKSGDIKMLRALIAGGADPFAAMPNGTTALMFAAGLGWRDGSPMAPSFDQGTAAEAVESIALLLELGLDINAGSESGDTPLHAAISGRGAEEIIVFLLERGADPLAENGRGQTPLAIAESRSTQAIAALVREAAGAH